MKRFFYFLGIGILLLIAESQYTSLCYRVDQLESEVFDLDYEVNALKAETKMLKERVSDLEYAIIWL